MDGQVTRHADLDFGLPAPSAREVERLRLALGALAETVSTSAPWDTPDAKELDRQTLDSWLTDNTDDLLARRWYRVLVPALFSAESPEMSLLHFLFYLKSGTSLETLILTTGGAQEKRVHGGTHLISEALAKDLGDAVRLDSVVHTVRHDDAGVEVGHDGGSVRARYAVISLPPTLAGRLRYIPALPTARDAVTQQVPAGSSSSSKSATTLRSGARTG